MLAVAVLLGLLVLWQGLSWLYGAYLYWSNYQTVELTVIRFEKGRLNTETDQAFSADYSPGVFYVQTQEFGWLRTDIETLDHIGPGNGTFNVTIKAGEWWIVGVKDGLK